MTSLRDVLIDLAENCHELHWPVLVRLAVRDADDMAVRGAVGAMRLWRDATDPMSRAFAGHALDRAARHLQVRPRTPVGAS